jgi:hypothetical protein
VKKPCKKAARAAKKSCKKEARSARRQCKAAAKKSDGFAFCKDARKLTTKALGTSLKCAGKHFGPAVLFCVGTLFSSE